MWVIYWSATLWKIQTGRWNSPLEINFKLEDHESNESPGCFHNTAHHTETVKYSLSSSFSISVLSLSTTVCIWFTYNWSGHLVAPFSDADNGVAVCLFIWLCMLITLCWTLTICPSIWPIVCLSVFWSICKGRPSLIWEIEEFETQHQQAMPCLCHLVILDSSRLIHRRRRRLYSCHFCLIYAVSKSLGGSKSRKYFSFFCRCFDLQKLPAMYNGDSLWNARGMSSCSLVFL